MSADLLIGTVGFEHPHWAGGFYPEELPADWRFCFYSNKLRAVLIPPTESARLDAASAQQWVDDSDPAFRFVLGLDDSWLDANTRAVRLAAVAPLHPQIAGWFWHSGGRAPAAEALALIEALTPIAPVCVDTPMTHLARDDVALLWDADNVPAPHAGGQFLVALTCVREPRRLRAILETLARWQGDTRHAALFFQDEKAGDSALQARLLADMMGV